MIQTNHFHQGEYWDCKSVDKRLEAFEKENAELKADLKQSQLFDKTGHKLLDISIKDGQDMVNRILKLEAVARAAEEVRMQGHSDKGSPCAMCNMAEALAALKDKP